MELCAPPDYNTRAPVEQLPPLSCDVHCHVFGPAEKFPYWEGRPYDAPDCPVELLWKMHATLGFERGASTLGQQLSFRQELDDLVAYAQRTGVAADATIRQSLAQA